MGFWTKLDSYEMTKLTKGEFEVCQTTQHRMKVKITKFSILNNKFIQKTKCQILQP